MPSPHCGTTVRLRSANVLFILVQQAGAFHHVNGVDVELSGNARFGLVLAEAEHAQARNQHDGRVGIAQRGRVGHRVRLVVLAIMLAIFGERLFDPALQCLHVFAIRPRHKHRPDLGTDKVIGTTRSEKGKILGVR